MIMMQQSLQAQAYSTSFWITSPVPNDATTYKNRKMPIRVFVRISRHPIKRYCTGHTFHDNRHQVLCATSIVAPEWIWVGGALGFLVAVFYLRFPRPQSFLKVGRTCPRAPWSRRRCKHRLHCIRKANMCWVYNKLWTTHFDNENLNPNN